MAGQTTLRPLGNLTILPTASPLVATTAHQVNIGTSVATKSLLMDCKPCLFYGEDYTPADYGYIKLEGATVSRELYTKELLSIHSSEGLSSGLIVVWNHDMKKLFLG